jgi:ribosomal subunit interface protein
MVISGEVKEYLDRKLDSISKLADSMDPSALLDIELERTTKHHQNGDIYRAELNLTIFGAILRAEEEEFDIKAAIDEAKDEMLRILKTKKGKRESVVRRSARYMKDVVRGIYQWPIRRVRAWRGLPKPPQE